MNVLQKSIAFVMTKNCFNWKFLQIFYKKRLGPDPGSRFTDLMDPDPPHLHLQYSLALPKF
jgi:hypothetical protein